MRRSPIKSERTGPPEAHVAGRALYVWLLLAIVFEYARPGSFVPVFTAVPLNTLLPISLLVAATFAKGLRPLKAVFSDAISWWVLVYLALIAIGAFHAEVTFRAFNILKLCLGYGILSFLIARICTTRARILGVVVTLIASHLFLLAMNPEVVTNPSQRNYIRGASFLGDGNDFALSLCILVPLSLAVVRTRRILFWRILWIAIALLLVIAIIGTSSRGATLGLLAVTSFIVVYSRRRGPILLAAAVAAAAVSSSPSRRV